MKPVRVRENEVSAFKSNDLWVGSLTIDTTESDLAELFGRFGNVDRITAYSSRSFAFIYFRHVEEAVAAKEALQGTNLNGSHIKIEYARPARPCKSLWVGGISPAVSKDELEVEFEKFGKIEDVRFLRERRTAFITFFELEDALQAAKSMNGKRIGGSYLRVDFLRSQAPRKYPQNFGDGKGDDQPSNVLWIGYPPSVQIDEQMLHNAMILFGEIETIKSFQSKHFALVEFRSSEEARRAKEGVQGRLFNDPRINIMYSTSDLPPGQDDTQFYFGNKRSRPEMFVNDLPFLSSLPDTYGRGHSIMGSGAPHSSGIPAPTRLLRGSMELPHAGAEYNDMVGKESGRRRPSPHGAGILPSPAQGRRPTPGFWEGHDGHDPAQLDIETKRARRDGSVDAYPLVGMNNRLTGLDRSYGPGTVSARPGRGIPNSDYIWRGIIAKGGTTVCHARGVPIGKGIYTELPEVINCSARTGLDMLAKHYTEAIGFDIVFFLPDSEDDFASYTEFLRYLSSKNRAGVAKLDDGTTLFLVPPSDFLTTVLKVPGPERLYGVVLRLPQSPVHGAASYRQEFQADHPPYTNQPCDSPSKLSYPATEDQAPSLDHMRGLQEELKPPAKPLVIPTSEPVGRHYNPKAGISLSPELIATLATFLPTTSQPISGTSTIVSTGTPLQGWKQDQSTPGVESTNRSFQQFGNQFDRMMHGGMQFQAPPVSIPQQQALLPGLPVNTHAMYPQNSHYTNSQSTTQEYRPEAPVTNQIRGAEAPGLQGYQTHTVNFSQNQATMSVSTDKAEREQPHDAVGAADGELDKNQRYQSTLQFAANLLFQIQRQQPQQ